MQSLGCTVDEITAEMTNKTVSVHQCMMLVSEKLSAAHYDAVFTINFYPVISEVCSIYKIPYICWTVDCPIVELYSDSIKNKWNRIFLFDYAQYQEFHPKNPGCIFYLPLAADTVHYDAVINSITPADSIFQSDISFVGSLYTEKASYNKADKLPPYLRGYLEGIMNSQLKVYGYNFLPEVLTEQIANEYKKYAEFYRFPEKAEHNEVSVLAHMILGYKIAELERIHLLGMLSEKYPVNLYTGSDASSLPHIHNKGRAKTLTEMPKIFHLSKINLNFTIKPIQTGIPLRIWDIMGCGGFVLTNYQQEIPEYFEIGKEIETFGSGEEMMEKAEYYLAHEEERSKIAKNGYEKVKKIHTWELRMKKILKNVFG